ncbi:PAS domain-containing sensor histidine kinase [Pedobacter aquatilis]|uniref:PAS domain-containing sensor histidine kinase n=1 Tax=Pedobacter aquatilis TaxID=351343 RepID=UPI00292E62EC|nr:PAS domain-containing sensor histidine kinase [Pedobacter aquatilis]
MPHHFFNSARISEEHLAIALAQVKLGFWELDLKSKLIECTFQNRINFGLSADQVITEQTIIDAIIPQDRWRREEGIKLAMHPETPTYDFEIRIKRPDGTIHWLHVRGTVIFEDSVPVRIIGTTIDISEKKGLEVLRDEFLNIATHELKSPLSVVKGYLQLLHKFVLASGDDKHKLIAERAIIANGKVERLMDEITDSRLHDQSAMILKKEQVNLPELIKEVISNTNITHEEIQIVLSNKSQNTHIAADRYRIAQVLTNLVNNAIKYSPGESHIVIEIAGDSEDIRVSVSDNGIGIAENEREKVFEKFYRVENSSQLAAGSGIGLYLCSEIIARHGGKLGIISNPTGKGTSAYFTLPL